MTLLSLQQDGQVPTGGQLIQGKDGSGNAQDILVDTDGTLQVDIVSGGSSGAQYTEGDTDTTITGTAAMGEAPSNTLEVLQLDSSSNLKVSIEADNAGIGGGIQYTEGDTDATITGTAMLMEGAGNALVVAQGTVADGLLVNLGSNNDVSISGTVTVDATGQGDVPVTLGGETVDTELPAAEALADNASNPTTPTVGAALLGYDGTTWDRLRTVAIGDGAATGLLIAGDYMYNGSTWDRVRGDSTNGLLVNLGSNNDVSLNAGTNVIGITRIQDSGGDEINISAFPASDGAAIQNNVTTAAFPLAFNGTTWDRVRGDATNGLLVNLGSNNDVTVTGTVDLGATDNAVLDSIDSAVNGTLTVDGSGVTQPVSGTVTANLGATDNAVLDTIASPVATISATPLQRVAIFDSSDSQITSFGGGTQYTEDSAAPTNPVGTAMMMERDDVLGGLTPVAGDWTHPYATAEGALWVQDFNSDAILADTGNIDTNVTAILADTASMDTNLGTIAGAVSGSEVQVDIVSGNVTNAGTFAVQVDGAALTALQLIDDPIFADDAAFTPGSSKVMMSGAVRDDTLSTLTAVEGDAVPLRVNSTGALHVTGSSGSTQYSEDSAHTTADTGTMALAVRNDSLGTLVDTDGDYAPLQVSGSGALYVRVDSSALPSGASTAANQSTIIGHVDGIEGLLTTIDADTGSIATNTSNSATSLGVMDDWDNAASNGASVSGDVAHDSVDAGEPVKIGGKAQTHLSDPDEVSDNDRVNGLFDRVGRMAVYQGYPMKSAAINTSSIGDNSIVTAVATKRIRVLSVLIVSDGTVDVRWESGAGGTALTGQVPLQAREGYAISNPWGLFETTAVNTALNLELSASVNVHGFVTYIEVDD